MGAEGELRGRVAGSTVARTTRTRRGVRAIAAGLVGAGAWVLACDPPGWMVKSDVRAPDTEVAVALGDTALQSSDELSVEDIPVVPYPKSLRPCCAFGANLKVAVGRVPVPGVELGNLVDPDEIGPHHYDAGYLSVRTNDPRGWVDTEANGLVYTCRGGFVDLAHVRDNADNTLALAAAVARMLETGGTFEVPPQGAAMRIRLRPVSAEAVARLGRLKVAVAMAKWLAFQLSIWHEIATFYGYASIAEWPEKISAFSPEDFYSNELGARLAAGIIQGRGARSDVEYGLSMDSWIRRMLTRLGAVPLKGSEAAARAVDGAWFDSQRRIPDWQLVLRRDFDPGPLLRPWRLEDASPGARGAVTPLRACRDAAPPLVLRVEEGFAGALFEDFARLEFEVEDRLLEGGFPLPRPDDRVVTQKDFPFVIARARSATLEALGPGADAP